MKDGNWKRKEPDSPCVRVCVVHPTDHLCVGCFRTLDEIAGWQTLSAQERAAVLADLPGRGLRLRKRRGGRAARTGNQAPPGTA